MQIFSALDAVSPAWTHTRRFLVEPRSGRLLLKVGLVAGFAGAAGSGGGNFNVPGGGRGNSPGQLGNLPHIDMAHMLPVLIAGGVVLLLLGLVLFYISSRLQLVFFEMVLRQDSVVGPMWRRYADLTWRWIGLRLLITVVTLVCLLPFAVPLGFAIEHLIRSGGGASGGDVGLAIIMGGLFVLILLVSAGVSRLIMDFGLPMMALEDTSISQTLTAVRQMVGAELGQFALYFLMRIVLAIGVGIVNALATFVVALILLIPLGGVAFVLWAAMGHSTTGVNGLLIACWAVLGLLFLALLSVFAFMMAGLVGTFYQAYVLYFLGGRYPRVGAYLEPLLPPAPPLWQPMVPPPPAYYGVPQT